MHLDYVFDPPEIPALPVTEQGPLFPLRRIFCVGRNYAAHAIEMGNEVDREAPFYFTKSAHCLCHTGREIAYPAVTQDCHYEMEFCVAIGAEAAQVSAANAMDAVFGYASGIDLTHPPRSASLGQASAPPVGCGQGFRECRDPWPGDPQGGFWRDRGSDHLAGS